MGGPGAAEQLAALPLAVLLVDPGGRVRGANAAAEALLNMSERALSGREVDAVVGLDAGQDRRRRALSFAAHDVDVTLGRGPAIRADLIEAALTDHDGWRVTAIHPTIGTQVHGASRAAAGAAALLAHEIKNPLSGIRGAAQLIAADGDTDGALTRLITREVDRIAALIDGMQGFTDTRMPRLTPQNVYPVLAHARGVAVAGFARDVPIIERFDPSLPPAVIDEDALTGVLLNLLKNAAAAVDGVGEGAITIGTAYRGGLAVPPGGARGGRPLAIEISVSDNGPGAPADIVEHMFDPFVSGTPGGRGLGLPLARKLVEGMGGALSYTREGVPPRTVLRVLLARAP